MPYAAFSTGPYRAVYDASCAPGAAAGKTAGARPLGLVTGVRRWQRILKTHPVVSALFGGAVIDGIYRGGGCYCRMTLKAWTPAVRDALWPFGETFGELGPIGAMLTDYAGKLTLTAEDHTLAARNGPAVITFGKAILAADETIDIPLGDVERDVPVVFQCFPYRNEAGKIVWFEMEQVTLAAA